LEVITMLSSVAVSEFADKYSDHIVFASSTGAGTIVASLWRVIPVELAALITAALFIAARVCIERWLHKHHDRKVRRHAKARLHATKKSRARAHV
jgi:hypothetical protein